MIQVKVAGLSLSNMGFVILLKGETDPRTLPIFIGGSEAQSIALQIDNVKIPRPLTHDLFKNVLDCLECRLKRVVISNLIESTFFAVMVLERDGMETEVDARPSDAIAMGMRCAAPLYVSLKVMDSAGVALADKDTGSKEPPREAGGTKVRTPSRGTILEQLRAKMAKAISEERYEEAAKLRDQITHIEQSHGKN